MRSTLRHRLLAVAAAVALGLALAGCGAPTRPFDRIFLVTIDTLRADHLGSYGYPREVSPFIDSLAERGVRFEQVVSSSSHTGPAHASLFTSQYPQRHGVLVNGVRLQDGIPTMAGLLGDAGYETAAFLSVEFLASVSGDFGFVNNDLPGDRRYRRAELTVNRALHWLSESDPSRPAFVWVHLFDVHQNGRHHRVPRPELERELTRDARRRAVVLRPHWARELGIDAGQLTRLTERINRYDAQLSYLDGELRRLVETAGAAGLRDLWIVTADHGEGLGAHGYVGHGKQLYQAQLRVPLIFFGGDDWPVGGTVDGMVRHVDLLPTVLEIAGAQPPEGVELEGHSLVPWLERPETAQRELYAYSQRRPPDPVRLDRGWPPGLLIAAQDERYKYILSSEGEDQFYDLHADPGELDNLIGQESRAKEALAHWLARKYEEMASDPLAAGGEIEGEYLEELKALGYL